VPGIEPGVYRYSPSQHALGLIHSTNLTPLLMRITTAPNIHPHMAPVNIFLTGDYLRARHHFGERGFRIMGIEIGRAIQGLSLAAAGRHLAVHIHLSYLFEATRQRLLHLASPSQLPLASMMIGYPRSTQGNLLEMVWY
jgi:SagB-type dehydrogenase family enzyme